MKAQSNEYPENKVKLGKDWLLRYNIEQKTRQNEQGEMETYYEFDSVKVPKLTKEAVVEAIVRTQYSQNDEFKMARISKSTNEWKEYNTFVENAISIAEGLLNV